MDTPDFGPEGCWKAAAILAIIGGICTIIGIVGAITWLCYHVHINIK